MLHLFIERHDLSPATQNSEIYLSCDTHLELKHIHWHHTSLAYGFGHATNFGPIADSLNLDRATVQRLSVDSFDARSEHSDRL